jgi:hypothetical protein
MAAFGQSRAGAFGLTAGVGYGSGSLGCEVTPIENLIIRPDFTFSLTDQSNATNTQYVGTKKYEDRTDTMTYGGNLAILYTLAKAGPVELALGPKGGIQYSTSSYRVTTNEYVVATDIVSYDNQTLSYNGALIGNVKFFLSPNFALYSHLGLKFTTSSTKRLNTTTAAGNSPTGGTSSDFASYSFSMETPAIGAIFYLK